MNRPEPKSLQTAIMAAHCLYLPNAVFAVAYKAESRKIVQVDLYSSAEGARRECAELLLGEDFQDRLAPAQLKTFELKIEEFELAKELAERALKDDYKRSRVTA